MVISLKNYALISLALALLAGGVAAFGYYEVNHTVPVVVAAATIPANQAITSQEVTLEQVPAGFAQSNNLVTTTTLAVGHMLSVGAVPGEPINTQMLNTASDLQALVNQYAQTHGPGYLATIQPSGALATAISSGSDIAIAQNGVLIAPLHILALFVPSGGTGTPSWFVYVPQNLYAKFSQVNMNNAQIMLYSQNGSGPSLTPSTSTTGTTGTVHVANTIPVKSIPVVQPSHSKAKKKG